MKKKYTFCVPIINPINGFSETIEVATYAKPIEVWSECQASQLVDLLRDVVMTTVAFAKTQARTDN